jgi:protease PrsW
MTSFPRAIFVILLSLLPCGLWLLYFYTRSVYKRPPLRLIALTFLLGGAATAAALPASIFGQALLGVFLPDTFWARALALFLVVGPVEELAKLLAVRLYAYRRAEFDEPLDGVIYATTAALGFAAVENVFYLAETGALILLLRGPLSNPGHALFSSLWGLSLSRAKGAPNVGRRRLWLVARGWLAASLLHGLFDVLLVASGRAGAWLFYALVGAMVALFFWVRSRIHFHRDASPHREGTLLLPVPALCRACGAAGEAGGRCGRCGAPLPAPQELHFCPVCQTRQREAAKFCARCGASLTLTAGENLDARPHFVAVSPAGEESIAFILNRREVSVGRTLNNGFVVEHPSVSKRHARLTAENGGYALSDLGSSNGTFVNGRRVTEAVKLADGCEVRFGRARFVYRDRHAGES